VSGQGECRCRRTEVDGFEDHQDSGGARSYHYISISQQPRQSRKKGQGVEAARVRRVDLLRLSGFRRSPLRGLLKWCSIAPLCFSCLTIVHLDKETATEWLVGLWGRHYKSGGFTCKFFGYHCLWMAASTHSRCLSSDRHDTTFVGSIWIPG
jgi:hypothetical protein